MDQIIRIGIVNFHQYFGMVNGTALREGAFGAGFPV